MIHLPATGYNIRTMAVRLQVCKYIYMLGLEIWSRRVGSVCIAQTATWSLWGRLQKPCRFGLGVHCPTTHGKANGLLRSRFAFDGFCWVLVNIHVDVYVRSISYICIQHAICLYICMYTRKIHKPTTTYIHIYTHCIYIYMHIQYMFTYIYI